MMTGSIIGLRKQLSRSANAKVAPPSPAKDKTWDEKIDPTKSRVCLPRKSISPCCTNLKTPEHLAVDLNEQNPRADAGGKEG
jgi:hypothetical protein